MVSVRGAAITAASMVVTVLCLPAQSFAQHRHRSAGQVDARGDTRNLGSVAFANSGAERAQRAFLRGVALLYSFGEPAASFREAERLDPGFALAFWGEALSHRWPQGGFEDTTAARDALERLGKTHAQRATRARTAREREYLNAVEILFGMPDSGVATLRSTDTAYSGKARTGGQRIDSVRIVRYAEAMRALHEHYPSDENAAVLYALALLNRRNLEWPTPDQHLRTSVEMGAALEDVFQRFPKHPGAAHLLIHAYDEGQLAPLGVRAARVYAQIAPDASHAQHMPGHIFIRYGLWDDVVRSGEKAWALTQSEAGTKPDAPVRYEWHNASFLEYGYLQQGRWNDAKRLADSAAALLDPDRIAKANPEERGMLRDFLQRIVEQYQRETEKYPNLSFDDELDPFETFLRRDPSLLDTLESRLKDAPDSTMDAESRRERLRQTRMFAAALAGKPDSAAGLLQRWCSSDLTDTRRAMAEGARSSGTTACEAQGELLLSAARYAAAVTAYDNALRDVPGHWIARLGRARALSCLGDSARAKEAYSTLLKQWARADADLPFLSEVKAGATGMIAPGRCHADDGSKS